MFQKNRRSNGNADEVVDWCGVESESESGAKVAKQSL